MSHDAIIEIALGFVGIVGAPWVVWVTTSIYGMRQQVALLKQEVHLLDEIKNLLRSTLNQTALNQSNRKPTDY